MVAFSASRLVRLATDLMKSSTEPISIAAAFTDCNVLLSLSASRVAAAAMVEDALTCSEISAIDSPSSSMEAAMVCTLFEASTAACETPSARVRVASAAEPMVAAVSCRRAERRREGAEHLVRGGIEALGHVGQ